MKKWKRTFVVCLFIFGLVAGVESNPFEVISASEQNGDTLQYSNQKV